MQIESLGPQKRPLNARHLRNHLSAITTQLRRMARELNEEAAREERPHSSTGVWRDMLHLAERLDGAACQVEAARHVAEQLRRDLEAHSTSEAPAPGPRLLADDLTR